VAHDSGGVFGTGSATQVIKEKEWTAAVVQKRQTDLVDKLKTVWRLV
jgi:hypothetical protein